MSPRDAPGPTLDAQRAFWDRWNDHHRTTVDDFMARQRDVAVEVATRENLRDARILDVGCGTGWLGSALLPFGRVTGTDLSTAAIAEGRRRHPDLDLISGDFLILDLDGKFDMVVSADVIGHVYARPTFVARVAELLRPGGVFLLMTQNPFVWNRSSILRPVGEGQIRNWPSLRVLRGLLSKDFDIVAITTLVPGGDRGVLWWVTNRYVFGAMRRLVGRQRWTRLLERVRLGRELVVLARRR